MFEPVGYCTISKTATSGAGDNWEKFRGQDIRVMEFAQNGGCLVVSRDGQSLCMFDKQDVIRKFECVFSGEFILPPHLKDNVFEQMAYSVKIMNRKGGYNPLLRNMIIQASLAKGEFNDHFLFAKQEQEAAEARMKQNQ